MKTCFVLMQYLADVYVIDLWVRGWNAYMYVRNCK